MLVLGHCLKLSNSEALPLSTPLACGARNTRCPYSTRCNLKTGTCDCTKEFPVRIGSNCLMRKQLGESCLHFQQCAHIENALCSKTTSNSTVFKVQEGRCDCKTGFWPDFKGNRCSMMECNPHDKECRCPVGYFYSTSLKKCFQPVPYVQMIACNNTFDCPVDKFCQSGICWCLNAEDWTCDQQQSPSDDRNIDGEWPDKHKNFERSNLESVLQMLTFMLMITIMAIMVRNKDAYLPSVTHFYLTRYYDNVVSASNRLANRNLNTSTESIYSRSSLPPYTAVDLTNVDNSTLQAQPPQLSPSSPPPSNDELPSYEEVISLFPAYQQQQRQELQQQQQHEQQQQQQHEQQQTNIVNLPPNNLEDDKNVAKEDIST